MKVYGTYWKTSSLLLFSHSFPSPLLPPPSLLSPSSFSSSYSSLSLLFLFLSRSSYTSTQNWVVRVSERAGASERGMTSSESLPKIKSWSITS